MIIYMGLISLLAVLASEYSKVHAADSNTVSSTVVTDKSVPTANAPSVVVNTSGSQRPTVPVGQTSSALDKEQHKDSTKRLKPHMLRTFII